jgi:hypothetical protein
MRGSFLHKYWWLVFVPAIVALIAVSQWTSSQNYTGDDAEFAEILAAISSNRRATRVTAEAVTEYFSPMISRMTMQKFHSFLSQKIVFEVFTDGYGPVEHARVDSAALQKLGARFRYRDYMQFQFRHPPNRSNEKKFYAGAYWDSPWP